MWFPGCAPHNMSSWIGFISAVCAWYMQHNIHGSLEKINRDAATELRLYLCSAASGKGYCECFSVV